VIVEEETPMASIDAIQGRASLSPAGPTLTTRLHQRIAGLEDVLRDGADATRTAVMAPLLERLKLLERMVRRLGVRLEGPIVGPVLREAEATCAVCLEAAHCRRWLDGTTEPNAYQRFCPNASLFRALTPPADRAAPRPPGGVAAPAPTLAARIAATLARWRRDPGSTVGQPSADELRRLRADAARRDTRALLELAYFP
jgi:hypothetical protein